MIALRPIDRLLQKLEGQREALLAGDMAAATADMDGFEKLMRMLSASEVGSDALQRVREAAKRNETLLAAARAGVMAARNILRPEQVAGFRSYTAQGRSDVIGGAHSKLEKRS